MKRYLPLLSALLLGLLFGFGLIISGMTAPKNVIGFLDIFGNWRPALAFVMGGGIIIALPFFWYVKKRGQSLFSQPISELPTKIDAKLIIGAAIFGIGWGLSGICPGPSIVWLGIDPIQIAPFIIAIAIGSFIGRINFKSK